MIRNLRDHDRTCAQIADFQQQIESMRARVIADGLDEETAILATAPTQALMDDLIAERDLYDRLVSDGPSAVPSYPPEERGKALIALRIACKLTQQDLAERLGVSPAQVSRDEKNDYHGITQERYAKVLAALGVSDEVRYRRSTAPSPSVR